MRRRGPVGYPTKQLLPVPEPPVYGADRAVKSVNYAADEDEFLHAMRAWMARTGRKFPSFVDVLNVAKQLGYRKDGNL